MQASTPVTTVLVAFRVLGLEPAAAEKEVEDRLNNVKILMQNDSTDWQRGTADPILTYAVLPVSSTLDEAV